jgi:hypothetical protein
MILARYSLLACCALLLSTGLQSQCFEADASIWQNTWASCSTSLNPKSAYGRTHWIQYDLGSVRKLSKSWVWNTNDPAELDRGFQEVHIDYSVDGAEWTYWGAMEFPRAEGEAVYGGFPGPDLVGLEARYVLLTASSNHGDPSCAGLAEVKFNLLPRAEGAPDDGSYENCQAVTAVEAVVIAEDAVRLTWAGIDNQEYFIEYRIAGTADWTTVEGDYDMAYLTGLTPLETYEYRITSVCIAELSEPATGTFVLDGAINPECPPVEQVIIQWIADTEAFIWWDMEEEGDFDLLFTYYPADNEAQRIEIPVAEAEIFLEDLQPNTRYAFLVMVVCEEQSQNSEVYEFTTRGPDEAPCEAVEDLDIDELSATTATFSWETAVDDLDFLVAYSPAELDDWTTVETNQLSITLNELQPETEYLLAVGSPCGEDLLWSEVFFFVTEAMVSGNEDITAPAAVKLFPNPTRGRIAIAYWAPLRGPLQYQLLSPLGQVVDSGQWDYAGDQQQFRLDLSALPDGVYHLQLSQESARWRKTERVVKISR